MLTTLKSLRIAIVLLLLGAVWSSSAVADHGTPGQSFTFLQAPFTQELFGTHADFADGIAFAPDGDVLIALSRLARYDRQGVEPNTHGDGLHPLTQLQNSGFSLGIVNHPDGTLYANTGGGVTDHDADTGAPLRGPFGPGGNGLGIAVDPKNNNIVYANGAGTVSFVDPGFTTSGVFSTVGGSYDGIFFDPTGDFLFLADFSIPGVTILRHDGTLVQHIPFSTNCCPDGIAFRAAPPRFVVTNNTDGTMTRLDFPGDDFTQPPTQTLFASGGFRGDLANVGPDSCLYASQGGTRFADGQTSSEGSIVRICPGFAPPINGKLEVKKSLSPPSDPGRFDLQIDGSTQKANAGDGDTTGETVVSTGSHSVGETGGTVPPTSLTNYTSSIVCKDQDGQGAVVAQSSDAGPLNVTINQNDDIVCTLTNVRKLAFAFAPGGGSFVVGDKNSATGTHVTFWGAQWWKKNSLSGGASPAAFKGFALKPVTPTCGTDWSTDPGNSAPPPRGPLPEHMAVIVTSKTTKSGSKISGNTPHIVVVKTDPGYQPNPGHPGTGTVEAQVC
jgi:hypothetical protein